MNMNMDTMAVRAIADKIAVLLQPGDQVTITLKTARTVDLSGPGESVRMVTVLAGESITFTAGRWLHSELAGGGGHDGIRGAGGMGSRAEEPAGGTARPGAHRTGAAADRRGDAEGGAPAGDTARAPFSPPPLPDVVLGRVYPHPEGEPVPVRMRGLPGGLYVAIDYGGRWALTDGNDPIAAAMRAITRVRMNNEGARRQKPLPAWAVTAVTEWLDQHEKPPPAYSDVPFTGQAAAYLADLEREEHTS